MTITSNEMDKMVREEFEKAGIPLVKHENSDEEGLEEWAKVFFTGRAKEEDDSNRNSSDNS